MGQQPRRLLRRQQLVHFSHHGEGIGHVEDVGFEFTAAE
jgi:hypothetical protein